MEWRDRSKQRDFEQKAAKETKRDRDWGSRGSSNRQNLFDARDTSSIAILYDEKEACGWSVEKAGRTDLFQ
jgi:hypothetical protein